MLLRTLKSNQAFNLILFPFIGLVLWSGSLISPKNYILRPGEYNMPIYKPIINLISQYLLLQIFIALAIVISIGFIIQKLNVQYSFLRIRTLLPSAIFVILVSGFKTMHAFHPVYIAAVLFLFAIDSMFNAFDKKNIFSNAFDSGLLIGVGSLAYLNLIILFPAFIVCMIIINRNFTWRSFALFFLGIIQPWIITVSIYFFIDQTENLTTIIKQNFILNPFNITDKINLLIFTGFVAILLIISSFKVFFRFTEKKIRPRKYFSSFFIIMISLFAIYIFIPSASIEIFILIAIPASYIISDFLISVKSKFWSEFIFYILSGIVIYMQFV